MKKEISRRTFLKRAGEAAIGIALGLGKAAIELRVRGQGNHQIFLPFIAKEPERVDDLITLLDEHQDYNLKMNPFFKRQEIQNLLSQNGKTNFVFHWVDSEEEVPYAGATQKGKEYSIEEDGTEWLVDVMMGVYSGGPPQRVEFWFYHNQEYFDHISRKYGEPVTSILSRSLSYQAWRAIIAPDRGYLWGEFNLRQPTPEEIQRYFMDNTLILASQQNT